MSRRRELVKKRVIAREILIPEFPSLNVSIERSFFYGASNFSSAFGFARILGLFSDHFRVYRVDMFVLCIINIGPSSFDGFQFKIFN